MGRGKQRGKYHQFQTDGTDDDEATRMRFNDGAMDPEGRYFAGTMNDPKIKQPTDEGVLFRLDPDRSLHRVIEGVSIPNGIGFTPDHKFMYFIDSPTKVVTFISQYEVYGTEMIP